MSVPHIQCVCVWVCLCARACFCDSVSLCLSVRVPESAAKTWDTAMDRIRAFHSRIQGIEPPQHAFHSVSGHEYAHFAVVYGVSDHQSAHFSAETLRDFLAHRPGVCHHTRSQYCRPHGIRDLSTTHSTAYAISVPHTARRTLSRYRTPHNMRYLSTAARYLSSTKRYLRTVYRRAYA